METAKLTLDGDKQIVSLPEQFHLPGNEVYIKKMGEAIVLISKENAWRSLFDSLDQFSDDFMDDRGQPPMQDREELF
jgi:antitoxin VapB